MGETGGDDNAAELGGHVSGGGLGLGGVPGGTGAVAGHVGGVVPVGGVPAGGEGLAGERERDGALDGAGGTVAGLPGAVDLLGVFYRDFNAMPTGYQELRLSGWSRWPAMILVAAVRPAG